MAQPFIGEIRMFAGNFAPIGWAFCDGQLLSIAENDALFALIGTTYGGDGETTFGLPDLRGRIPLHQGNFHVLAEMGGAEGVTLTSDQVYPHRHGFKASTLPGTTGDPTGRVLAQSSAVMLYRAAAANAGLHTEALAAGGGSQPHPNMQPYLAVSFIISLFGIFPSQG